MQVASVCIILYLFIGRRLRAWMPAFVYAHVVTGKSSLPQRRDVLSGHSLVPAMLRRCDHASSLPCCAFNSCCADSVHCITLSCIWQSYGPHGSL